MVVEKIGTVFLLESHGGTSREQEGRAKYKEKEKGRAPAECAKRGVKETVNGEKPLWEKRVPWNGGASE